MPSEPKFTLELVTFPFGMEAPVANFYQEMGGSDGFSGSSRSVRLISEFFLKLDHNRFLLHLYQLCVIRVFVYFGIA
jgi:hypothetical protein